MRERRAQAQVEVRPHVEPAGHKVRAERAELGEAVHPRDAVVNARTHRDAQPRQLPRRPSGYAAISLSLASERCWKPQYMHLPWCSECASTSRNVEPAFFSRCRLSSTRPPIGSSGCESRQAASVCDAKVQRRRQTRLRDATASVAAAGRRRAIWRGRSTYERASVCERPKGRKRVCSSARPGSGALTVLGLQESLGMRLRVALRLGMRRPCPRFCGVSVFDSSLSF